MPIRPVERESLEYIDCVVPRDMTLREWRRSQQPETRAKRLAAVAGVVGRAARRHRRG